ncbi:hypothetical protein RP20_CCG006981 [Aedes albopictus]|nr:hypothetical protein RP20_CCG006981 [Aedes albopictus]
MKVLVRDPPIVRLTRTFPSGSGRIPDSIIRFVGRPIRDRTKISWWTLPAEAYRMLQRIVRGGLPCGLSAAMVQNHAARGERRRQQLAHVPDQLIPIGKQ